MKLSLTSLNTPWKHAVIAVCAFGLAYAAASLAIDTGRLLVYFIAIVLLVIGLRQTALAITKVHAK